MAEGELEELRRIAEERKLTPCHGFFATFVAALNETGVLNPGVVKFVTSKAAEILYKYLLAMGRVKPGVAPEEFIDSVLKALDWGEWSIQREDSIVHLKVVTDKCKYCPKGVGRAMLPAPVCPLPGLLEKMLQLAGYNASLAPERHGTEVRLVVKREGRCHIRFKIG